MTRGSKSGGKRYLKPGKDILIMRLAEVFKDTDALPLEEVVLLVGQALPPAVAHRYYYNTIDARRLLHVPITHRTSRGGNQTDEYRIYMGRRYRAHDSIRNQIHFGRFIREEIDGVKYLRITKNGRNAVDNHWLKGEVAPVKWVDGASSEPL